MSVTARAAEFLLQRIGIEAESDDHDFSTITGFQSITGAQSVLRIPSADLRTALQPVLAAMVNCATTLFRDIPHAWGSEIIDTGLLLSGGGSLLRSMRERIEAETRLTVTRADDPLGAVVRGARDMLPVADMLQLWR